MAIGIWNVAARVRQRFTPPPSVKPIRGVSDVCTDIRSRGKYGDGIDKLQIISHPEFWSLSLHKPITQKGGVEPVRVPHHRSTCSYHHLHLISEARLVDQADHPILHSLRRVEAGQIDLKWLSFTPVAWLSLVNRLAFYRLAGSDGLEIIIAYFETERRAGTSRISDRAASVQKRGLDASVRNIRSRIRFDNADQLRGMVNGIPEAWQPRWSDTRKGSRTDGEAIYGRIGFDDTDVRSEALEWRIEFSDVVRVQIGEAVWRLRAHSGKMLS